MSHVLGGSRYPSPMSSWGGREEGTGVGTVRSNASWLVVTWAPPREETDSCESCSNFATVD